MKRITRSLFVLTILLAIAQPTFACIVCGDFGWCTPGIGLRCKPTEDGCTHSSHFCNAPEEPLAAEYRIASVEIAHESELKLAEVNDEKKSEAKTKVASLRR